MNKIGLTLKESIIYLRTNLMVNREHLVDAYISEGDLLSAAKSLRKMRKHRGKIVRLLSDKRLNSYESTRIIFNVNCMLKGKNSNEHF